MQHRASRHSSPVTSLNSDTAPKRHSSRTRHDAERRRMPVSCIGEKHHPSKSCHCTTPGPHGIEALPEGHETNQLDKQTQRSRRPLRTNLAHYALFYFSRTFLSAVRVAQSFPNAAFSRRLSLAHDGHAHHQSRRKKTTQPDLGYQVIMPVFGPVSGTASS